jgi:formylglycine-generating enzyme required for sulfatase activity
MAGCAVAECPPFPELDWTVSCNAFNHCEYAKIGGLAEDMEILVPPGAFVMGNPAVAESRCENREDDQCPVAYPATAITFTRGYFIDKFEVSIRQYARCVEQGACSAPSRCFGVQAPWSVEDGYDPNKALWPVGCVTLSDAMRYCEWAGKTVPSEAQWERAAKGTSHRTYPWGDQPSTCDLAHTHECINWMGLYPNVWLAEVDSHPLGTSPVGAINMGGNVAEWVQDCFHSSLLGGAPADGTVWTDDCYLSEDGFQYDTKKGGSVRHTAEYARPFTRMGVVSCADCIGAGGDEGIRCARLGVPSQN